VHSLLRRQLRRQGLDPVELPAALQTFVATVDEAYEAFDADRITLERSLELTSQELLAANKQLSASSEQLRDELTYQAFHDSLTGLANRVRLKERLEHALQRRRRTAERALVRRRRTDLEVAVLFVDLDDFKSVNDAFGHSVGDALLVALARRLEGCVRPGDTLARFGGDEFSVLVEDCPTNREAVAVAARVLECLAAPFDLDGREVRARASIGIAWSGNHDEVSIEGLLRDADTAMYAAKARGKHRAELYDANLHAAVQQRLQLLSELQGALHRDEFVLQYQPVVELATGRIVGVEALVRWRHPARGLVPPAEFIGLAEECGSIRPLGEWVLRTACHQMRDWQRQFPQDRPLHVGVNVSAHQMTPRFVEEVAAILTESDLPPRSLILEVTESVMMTDAASALALLAGLKSLGVRLAIDDFGTGYSSLSYLHRFPFDILKIDKSFLDDGEEGGAELTGVIAEIGKIMQLDVVAEGIERPDQLARLQALHCDFGQGFHFSRPLFAPDLARMLSNQTDGEVAAA
jgi:diguanylate cyclase (GGDEF)-like protein